MGGQDQDETTGARVVGLGHLFKLRDHFLGQLSDGKKITYTHSKWDNHLQLH